MIDKKQTLTEKEKYEIFKKFMIENLPMVPTNILVGRLYNHSQYGTDYEIKFYYDFENFSIKEEKGFILSIKNLPLLDRYLTEIGFKK